MNNIHTEQEIVIASTNQGKILDFKYSLAGLPLRILDLCDFSLPPFPEEDGLTFAENALIKARHVYKTLNKPVLADDSGLVVPGLGGAPGVKSSRWATHLPDGHLFKTKMRLVWDSVCAAHAQDGNAVFVCSLVFISQGQEKVFHGELVGRLVSADQREHKGHGFGYDAMFMPHGYHETFAEMSPAIKRRISHRGLAVRKFIQWWNHTHLSDSHAQK